jgi:uncharacterized protein with NRDE domain
VTDDGRLAALTNFREGLAEKAARSRGEIVVESLREGESPSFLGALRGRLADYGGFNLVFGRPEALRIFSSRTGEDLEISPGVRALSNHDLDTPWPKVSRTRDALGRLVSSSYLFDPEVLFEILSDRTPAEDHELPETGVGLALERFLSAPFIVGPEYGTRSSTVVLFRTDGVTEFRERTFDRLGRETGMVSLVLGAGGG